MAGSETGAPPLALPTGETAFAHSYVGAVAQLAYAVGYPTVNMMNRRARLSAAPEPGRLAGVLPAAPTGHVAMLNDYIDPGQTFIACPNQDVVYGLGFFSLDEQPVVVQVPDFGDRFYVYAFYDARTDQFGHVGSLYGSVPGLYLLAGPNWDGDVPQGIVEVIRSPTALANAIPRIFMDDTDEDRAAIAPLVDQVLAYPLDECTGEMKTKDWGAVPSFDAGPRGGDGETSWVVPGNFFDQFAEAMTIAPARPGEEGLYAQFGALWEAARGDAAIKQRMVEAFEETDSAYVADVMRWSYNGKPAGNAWNRSQHNSEWGFDYHNRAATSKSNMFENRANETQYFYTDTDSSGAQLTGDHTYEIAFAAGDLPPVDGFWSLTMYNDAHFFHPNDLRRYSLGTKNKTLVWGDDGSLTLYAGHRSPGGERDRNWLPSPADAFS
ncbi:MAG TPA: DUF1254 domain-containing protein, partial [Acidimicrobiales bacterium]